MQRTAGVGLAVGIFLARLQGGEIAVERADGRKYERFFGQIAGVADKVARGKVVGAVGDNVIARDDLERIPGIDAPVVGFHAHVRVELADRFLRALDLGDAHMRRVMHDLALQVVEGNPIVVDDAERADAGCCQVHEHGRPEPARTDHQDPGSLDLLLPLAAHLAQHEMPLVALDFFRRESH